jgi:hypothetical protein
MIKFWDNVSKILGEEAKERIMLGSPSASPEEKSSRATALAQMVSGRGFRSLKKQPATHPTEGTTRGERKRAKRAVTAAAVSEFRPSEHSHPRSRRG